MRTQFSLGAKASCTDGFCGVVSRTIIDPAAGTITHLVVEPRHRKENGRLVPVELVDATAGEIRLRCTLAEFDGFDPAEEVEVVDGGGYDGSGQPVAIPGFGTPGGFGMVGPASGLSLGTSEPVMVSHAIPVGETEVGRHEHVHAIDGEIGQVEGFMVNRGDHAVTHVLLKEGHLWGRKQVAIPVSAIASVADGIRLSITKKQVEDLPPVPAAEGGALLRPGGTAFPQRLERGGPSGPQHGGGDDADEQPAEGYERQQVHQGVVTGEQDPPQREQEHHAGRRRDEQVSRQPEFGSELRAEHPDDGDVHREVDQHNRQPPMPARYPNLAVPP